jgi:acid phosphatase (class A)
MRKLVAGSVFAALLIGRGAPAAEYIAPIPVEDIIPPPPHRGSAIEQGEIAEILKKQAAASSAALALAERDNDTEDASIFASALGPAWDLAKLPKTKFLVDRIMDVDRSESRAAKKYFHRARPWIVDPNIHTCAPHSTGRAEDSYPSGHTMLGFEIGLVLASLMPNHAQTILARASQYGENRILCGFHFRSDVSAGEQFGSALAVELMQNPVFVRWFAAARSELQRAGLAR